MATVQRQARLMEAMARFNQAHTADPTAARAAALQQIREAHTHFRAQQSKPTVEFSLAQREGDHVVSLLQHRQTGMERLPPLPFNTERAEPMRRALLGQAGAMVGVNYRGQTVLVAYEPVRGLDLGLVAQMDRARPGCPSYQGSGQGASSDRTCGKRARSC